MYQTNYPNIRLRMWRLSLRMLAVARESLNFAVASRSSKLLELAKRELRKALEKCRFYRICSQMRKVTVRGLVVPTGSYTATIA